MTTEYVLILALYAFILLGALLGSNGPVATFKSSGPRLSAKLEENIQIGKGNGTGAAGTPGTLSAHGFNNAEKQGSLVIWADPNSNK